MPVGISFKLVLRITFASSVVMSVAKALTVGTNKKRTKNLKQKLMFYPKAKLKIVKKENVNLKLN